MEDRKKMRPASRRIADDMESGTGEYMEAETEYPDAGDIYRVYMEEIAAIKACDARENELLLAEARKGNREARNRLVEGNLRQALFHVQDFLNKGVPMVDLIQEASLEIMMFADEFESGDFAAEMGARIRARLEEVVREQRRETDAAEEMLARVNVLQEVSRRMAEELGREATLKELSERMKMTEDEVREIMKVTMDALSLSEANRELQG